MNAEEDVLAKLDRAAQHLDALDDGISRFLATEPYRFTVEDYVEGEDRHLKVFLEVDALPSDAEWGPLIGDAAHNLRSALDHLAWQLALTTARHSHARRIEFPIFLDHPDHHAGAAKALRQKLGYLRPEARSGVDAMQPYQSGDSQNPLWLLQALWNMDKHRLLHTAGFLYSSAADNPPGGLGFTSWSWGPFPQHEGGVARIELSHSYGRFNTSAEDLATAHEGTLFDVSLGHADTLPSADEPYAGLPIRQVLRRIERHVTRDVVARLVPLL